MKSFEIVKNLCDLPNDELTSLRTRVAGRQYGGRCGDWQRFNGSATHNRVIVLNNISSRALLYPSLFRNSAIFYVPLDGRSTERDSGFDFY